MTAFRRSPRIASWTMAGLALGFTLLTLHYHSWTASGSDASGYVSQADLWRRGALTVPQPLARDAPWPEPEWTFSPLGYRPALVSGAIVPTYPAGLPLTLAAAQLFGGPDAVYLVVPILAGLGIWATFLLGRQLGGDTVGAIAATLLAVSPIYLRQSTQVMSDVPAAAWWTLAVVLAQRASLREAFGAGLAASLAVATRPNLVPVALAIGAAVAAAPARARRSTHAGQAAPENGPVPAWSSRARRLAAFASGLAPGCLLVAALHTHFYGSPLRSGYGSNADLYSLANVPENARLYATWLLEGQTPLLLLALGAGFVRREPANPQAARAPDAIPSRRAIQAPPTRMAAADVPLWPMWLLIGLVAVVYLPYVVFEAWWYIRFLLPAFPAAFALVALTLAGAARLLPPRARTLALITVTAALVSVSVARARALHVFDPALAERRYAQVATAIATSVSTDAAAFICMEHSGSLRHYLDRPILRWDALPPDRLETALDYLRGKGYRPYILLDSWEVARFRARFAPTSTMGRLDWPPIVELHSATPVRLYDPSDRARYLAGEHIPTRHVFPPKR